MTRDQLAEFNGQNDQPAYVAVGGIVYDVSQSPMWRNGLHADTHQAGCDLTLELKSAPHIAAVIERFPSVGRLETESDPASSNGPKTTLIAGALLVLLILLWLLMR